MTVGKRIKELREAKGWSQTELANRVNRRGGKLAQQSVANIETGIVKQPKAIVYLAEALGVLPRWLETGKGAKFVDASGRPAIPGVFISHSSSDTEPVKALQRVLSVRYAVREGGAIIEATNFDLQFTPPGGVEAAIVEAKTLQPYEAGDILIWGKIEPLGAGRVPGHPVIVATHHILLLRQLVPGTKKGRYHLLSIDRSAPHLPDQKVEGVAQIEWVKKAQT
jgi:transcriptional regulator with XRE-family HTH domain